MKPTELRIGNLLWLGKIEKPESVFNLKFEFSKEWLINDVEIEHFRPIELTQEWLQTFGFEFVDQGGFEMLSSGWGDLSYFKKEYLVEGNQYEFRIHYGGSNNANSILIKHVHQLQNLYFSLTGKELELSKVAEKIISPLKELK